MLAFLQSAIASRRCRSSSLIFLYNSCWSFCTDLVLRCLPTISTWVRCFRQFVGFFVLREERVLNWSNLCTLLWLFMWFKIKSHYFNLKQRMQKKNSTHKWNKKKMAILNRNRKWFFVLILCATTFTWNSLPRDVHSLCNMHRCIPSETKLIYTMLLCSSVDRISNRNEKKQQIYIYINYKRCIKLKRWCAR